MRRRLGLLGLILGLILPLVAVVPAAAQGGTTMVGTTPVTFNGDWALSPSSNANVAYLMHNGSQPESAYFYMEVDVATLPIPDALYVIEVVMLPNFRDSFGVATTPFLAQGGQATETPAPNAWELFSADLSTGPALVLFAVDMNRVPGKAAVEYMIAAPQNLPGAFASAQTGITMNGQPNQFAGIDSSAVLSGAGIDSSASVTQPQDQPPPQVSTQAPVVATETPAPVTQAAGTATVGTDSIAYGGEWQYSADISDTSVGFFQSSANPQHVYGYFLAPGPASDPVTALQQFSEGFFSDSAPGSVQSFPIETLTTGPAWSLHVSNEEGISSVYLMFVDVTTPDTPRFQVLNAPAESFPTALASIQGAIQINGASAFAGVDPARATSLLGGAPAPAQVTTQGQGADSPAVTTSAGCDATGSVIIDPAQRPVTQADIDGRAVCVGGATYVATCGTYATDSTFIECTINVGVGDAPIAVMSSDFTLLDSAGVEYPVDMEQVQYSAMLMGSPTLPEGQVAAGTTASGTIIFHVPASAPTPWTIRVAPESIATTGEQSGVLTIDGPLQSIEVFAQ